MRIASVMNVYLILHNIRSAHNVGSLFRSADGAGVTRVFLTGYTPTPLDRFSRKNKMIAKTALGAEDSVLWEVRDDIETLISELKRNSIEIIALEQYVSSRSLVTYVPTRSFALICGNEIDGLSREICEIADRILHIDMHGNKESLNVSVAGAIALFNIRSRLPRDCFRQ